MHVGVKIGPATGPEVAERAAHAEALGYDSVWVSERVAVPVDKPHPYQPMADPWVALAFIAARTERVKLGTSVSQIALRPPVLMARELATLDRLSEGRLIVGAGAGWVEEEFTSVGVDFATRGGRLNEFVRVLRHLWTTPEEPWNGKRFQVPGVKIVMPLTPGGPPVYIGASTPAGMKRVARYADGFLTVHMKPDALAALRAHIDGLTAALGRPRLPMISQVYPPTTAAEARELIESARAAGIDGVIVAHPLDDGQNQPPDDVSRTLIDCARD
jgi:probable F420-dependent oxidoreductase